MENKSNLPEVTTIHDGMNDTVVFQPFDPDQLEEDIAMRENAELIFRPKFIPFYPALMDIGLSVVEILLYGFIDFYLSASPNKKFYFTNKQLSYITGKGNAVISRSVKTLREKGLIQTTFKTKGDGSTMRFIRLVPCNNYGSTPLDNLDSPPLSKRYDPLIKMIRPPYQNDTQIRNINNNIKDICRASVKTEDKSLRDKFKKFIQFFNRQTERNFRETDKAFRHFKARMAEGYSSIDMSTAINNAFCDDFLTGKNDSGKWYLTPEYILRQESLEKWRDQDKTDK